MDNHLFVYIIILKRVSKIMINELIGICTPFNAGIKLEWSNSGETLAVAGVAEPEAGSTTAASGGYRNLAKFYTADTGSLRFVAPIPCAQKPVTALTWG